jgi:hypothetical protein
MGSYSKLIGSIVGGVAGWLASRYALPPTLTSPEIQGAATVILSAVVTYLFPANAAPTQPQAPAPAEPQPKSTNPQ